MPFLLPPHKPPYLNPPPPCSQLRHRRRRSLPATAQPLNPHLPAPLLRIPDPGPPAHGFQPLNLRPLTHLTTNSIHPAIAATLSDLSLFSRTAAHALTTPTTTSDPLAFITASSGIQQSLLRTPASPTPTSSPAPPGRLALKPAPLDPTPPPSSASPPCCT